MQVPAVAHLLRMNTRYYTRLGDQLAGAITYFSLLAMVPILMFAFSACGFTLTVLRPDLLERLQAAVMVQLQGAPEDLQAQLTGLIGGLLRNWASVGLVGLLSSMYSGAGWAGNLKSAVRAQTRPLFDVQERKRFILLELLVNFSILLGLLVILAVTFALAVMATSLTGTIVHWLSLDEVPGINVLLRIAGPILSAISGWAMFVYLYKVLPEHKFPFRIIARGCAVRIRGPLRPAVPYQFPDGQIRGQSRSRRVRSGYCTDALFQPFCASDSLCGRLGRDLCTTGCSRPDPGV